MDVRFIPAAELEKDSFVHQFRSKRHRIGIVHCKYPNRCSAHPRLSQQTGASPGKVTLPTLLAGIEKRRETTARRVDPRDVRSFVLVAMQATPSKIFWRRQSAMLLSNDMVHLKRQRVEIRWNEAVFAPILCALPHLFQQLSIHVATARSEDGFRSVCLAFDCRIPKV